MKILEKSIFSKSPLLIEDKIAQKKSLEVKCIDDVDIEELRSKYDNIVESVGNDEESADA